MCKYHFYLAEYKCNREEYKDGFCIFHCDKKNFTEEEIEKFNKEFWKEFERQEKDENLKEFNFIGFKFPDGFSFEGKEFKKAVIFTGATFSGDANFTKATFSGDANFLSTTFNSKAYFLEATFNSKANFSRATFNSEAYFSSTTFNSEAYFLSTTFNSEAYFSSTTFNSKAEFLLATFNSETNFSQATFNSETNFLSTTFNSETNFLSTTFNIKANFLSTTFNSKANFSRATFKSKAEFSSTTFNSKANFLSTTFNSKAYFSFANFKTPEDVEFLNVDLSKASFIHCKNIDRIGRFERIKWSEIIELLGKRKAIYDEIFEATYKKENYEYIAEIYRKLRINYEKDLQFAEAGDFYIGEMEMRRKKVKTNISFIKNNENLNDIYKLVVRNFSAIAFYKYFSYYGENYWLPLGWIFIAVVTFSFLLSTDILTSTQIFLQFPPVDLNVKVKDLLIPIINFKINSGWFVLSERILGILFIALFVLALRRKFKKGGE